MARIFLVDDSKDLLDFLSLLLRMNKHEVRTASSKKELLREIPSFVYDIMLLDVMLNGESGRDICRQLKESNKDQPVILLSANPGALLDYAECGADDIIEKPFNINDVLNKINLLIKVKN